MLFTICLSLSLTVVSEMASRTENYLQLYNGYKFRLKYKLKSGKSRWCCANKKCPAKFYTPSPTSQDIDFTTSHINHNHRSTGNTLSQERVANNLKTKLNNTEDLRGGRPKNILLHHQDEHQKYKTRIRNGKYARKAAKTANSQYHFEESQFEQARKDGWKKLKPNAVPTIFDPTNRPQKLGENLLRQQQNLPADENAGIPTDQNLESVSEVSNHSESNVTLVTNDSLPASEFQSNEELNHNSVSDVSTTELSQTEQSDSNLKEDETSIDGALKKLDQVLDKFNLLSHKEDGCDHFGKYVAAVLRSLPSQKAYALQKKFVDLISESQSDTPVNINDSSIYGSTSLLLESENRSEINQRDNYSKQSQASKQHPTDVTPISMSVLVTPPMTRLMPTQTEVPQEMHSVPDRRVESTNMTTTTSSNRYQSKHSNNVDLFVNMTDIDDALLKLDELSKKFNCLDQGEDAFDHFGRYIAYHLRSLLLPKVFTLQMRVIDLILKSFIQ